MREQATRDTIRTQPPTVSIIIRTYNRPSFLSECLESVRIQAYPYIETVVVWNGGERATVTAPNLVNVEIRKTSLGAAMNAGVAASSGDYIYVLDDDDMLLPTAIVDSVEVAEGTAADLVFSDLLAFGDGQTAVFQTHCQTFCECLWSKCIPHPSSMYRRSFLLTHSLRYDPEYENAEDYDFILRFLLAEPKMAKVLRPVYLYRIHSSQQRRTLTECVNARRIRSKYAMLSQARP
jgi:glycosyltransferase involved in cell wall biosynthesis